MNWNNNNNQRLHITTERTYFFVLLWVSTLFTSILSISHAYFWLVAILGISIGTIKVSYHNEACYSRCYNILYLFLLQHWSNQITPLMAGNGIFWHFWETVCVHSYFYWSFCFFVLRNIYIYFNSQTMIIQLMVQFHANYLKASHGTR